MNNSYLSKIYRAKSIKEKFGIVRNSINYRKHLFWVERKDVKEILMEDKAYKKLKKKYEWVLVSEKNKELETSTRGKKIWVCWFQGIENAPLLVQMCVKRMKCVFGADRVVVITEQNFCEYVKLTEHIIEKWRKGNISYAHFSDILRIWLLAEYGGTWIDSTVMILSKKIPEYFFNEELFVFSNMKRNSIINMSNWFITAYSHNRIIECMKRLLDEYWKEEDYAIHYLFFHLLFVMATENYPELWKKVPKFSNIQPHILANEVLEQYNEKRLEQIAEMCGIQKLSNKIFADEQQQNSYYNTLLKGEIKFY